MVDNLPRMRNDGTPIGAAADIIADLEDVGDAWLKLHEDSLDHVLFSPVERKVIVRRWRETGGRWTLQQMADTYEKHALMEWEERREDPFYDMRECGN